MADSLIPSGGKHSAKPDTYSGLRLPLEKVMQILELHDAGHKPTAIARHVGSDPRTVGGVLRNYQDRPTSAKALLIQAAPQAAASWLKAINKAEASGNHNPMKDLLLHVGAIAPAYGPGASKPVQVGVQIVLGTPQSPIDLDPVANLKSVK